MNGLKDDIKEVKNNIKEVRLEAKVNFDNLTLQFNNHLTVHRAFDKEIFERLAKIETKVSDRK